MAVNALYVAWTCWTFLSWSWTAELSPPYSGPQVTILPPPKYHNAKASCVAATFASARLSPSPQRKLRHCVQSTKVHPAQVINFRKPCPMSKCFLGQNLPSPTLDGSHPRVTVARPGMQWISRYFSPEMGSQWVAYPSAPLGYPRTDTPACNGHQDWTPVGMRLHVQPTEKKACVCVPLTVLQW